MQITAPVQQRRVNFNIPADPPTEVVPGVYIGSLDTAAGPHNCTYVISMIACSPEHRFSAPPTTIFPMIDGRVTGANLEMYIKKFNQALDTLKMLLSRGHRVLVHCAAGINRSATLIGLYLIDCGFTPEEAIGLLEEVNKTRNRPALTNRDFRRLITARYIMKKQKLKSDHLIDSCK